MRQRRGYPHALLFLRGHGHGRLAHAEPVERIGYRKDAVRARVEPDVVRAGIAADGYLVCELGEEVVEIG